MVDGPIPRSLLPLLLFGVTLPALCGSQFLPGDPVRDVVGRVGPGSPILAVTASSSLRLTVWVF